MRPEGKVAEALSACGIDPLTVNVDWDDELQNEVLRFDNDPNGLSDAALDGLVQISMDFHLYAEMDGDAHLRFNEALARNPQHQARMAQMRVEMREQGLAELQQKGLGDFTPYDPTAETLDAFAARVEATLGLEAGGVLSVAEGRIFILPGAGGLDFPQFQTLLALLSQGDAELGLISEDLEDDAD